MTVTVMCLYISLLYHPIIPSSSTMLLITVVRVIFSVCGWGCTKVFLQQLLMVPKQNKTNYITNNNIYKIVSSDAYENLNHGFIIVNA